MRAGRKSEISDTLPDDCDLRIREIAAYWLSLCDADRLPDRSEIDPVQIAHHLPGIGLIDVVREPWRFRFRLLGEELVILHGVNLTGQWLDEAFPHFEETKTRFDMIETADISQPVYYKGKPYMTYEKSFIEIERVMLPFRNGGDDADLILIYSILR
jgi:hypothetical protein